MKEGHCHLEGEARVASHQVKQEKDFNNYPTLPVLIILFIWRTEVTLIHFVLRNVWAWWGQMDVGIHKKQFCPGQMLP